MTTPVNPITYIDSQTEFEDLCSVLLNEEVLGLDVETTLGRDQTLCTIQFANETQNWVIDALALDDLSPVEPVLMSDAIVKVIHYAAFERKIFAKNGYKINNVFDTCTTSRRLRKGVNGHKLMDVCKRELNLTMDKQWQTSDWTTRPLLPAQLNYAALDAEVMVKLYRIFKPMVDEQATSGATTVRTVEAGSYAYGTVATAAQNAAESGRSGRKPLTSGPLMPVDFTRGEVFSVMRELLSDRDRVAFETFVDWISQKLIATTPKKIELSVIRGFIRDGQTYRILVAEDNVVKPSLLRLEDYSDEVLGQLLLKLLYRATSVSVKDAPFLFLCELGLLMSNGLNGNDITLRNDNNEKHIESQIEHLIAVKKILVKDGLLYPVG